jgi:hypothetical protein
MLQLLVCSFFEQIHDDVGEQMVIQRQYQQFKREILKRLFQFFSHITTFLTVGPLSSIIYTVLLKIEFL